MLSGALYPRLAPLTHSWQAQLIRAREERELSHEQLGAARNEVVESQARDGANLNLNANRLGPAEDSAIR